MTALQRREERVIRMFKRCVERGSIPAEYALILIENDRAYGWMSSEAREEFAEWIDEIMEAEAGEEIEEEPAEEPAAEETEEEPGEDPEEEAAEESNEEEPEESQEETEEDNKADEEESEEEE